MKKYSSKLTKMEKFSGKFDRNGGMTRFATAKVLAETSKLYELMRHFCSYDFSFMFFMLYLNHFLIDCVILWSSCAPLITVNNKKESARLRYVQFIVRKFAQHLNIYLIQCDSILFEIIFGNQSLLIIDIYSTLYKYPTECQNGLFFQNSSTSHLNWPAALLWFPCFSFALSTKDIQTYCISIVKKKMGQIFSQSFNIIKSSRKTTLISKSS